MALAAGPGHAQDDTDTARQLLEQGDAYLARGDARRAKGREKRAQAYYEKALGSYQKAFELVPKTAIYFAIANAESRLGRYQDAIEHYQKVLAEVDNAELTAMARRELEALSVHVATLIVHIEPKGAELSIDADLRGVAPIEQPIMLAPGEHIITVTADGYTPYEVTLSLALGSRTEKRITLEKMAVLVKEPKSLDDQVEQNPLDMPETRVPRKPSKKPLIIGSLATGGLLATSVVTGVLGLSEEDQTLQIVGVVAGVAALGAAGYTTYHYFGVYRPKRAAFRRAQRVAGPKLWWTPYVHGHGGGMAVGGLF